MCLVLPHAPQHLGRGHRGGAEDAPARNSGCGGPFVTPVGAKFCATYVYARTAAVRTRPLLREEIVNGPLRLCLFSSEDHKSARRAQNHFLTAGACSATLNCPGQCKGSCQVRVLRAAACPPSSRCCWESKCSLVPGWFCCLWVVVIDRCCFRIVARCLRLGHL